MARDIVERLRDRAYSGLPDPLLEEAADEIDRLRNGALANCETVQSDHIPDAGKMAKTSTNHDAAPAARASVDSVAPQPTTRGESDRNDKAAPRPSEGTGDTPATQTTPGECSKPRECTEPVAWAVIGSGETEGHVAGLHDTRLEAEMRIARMNEVGDCARARTMLVVPLYRSPTLTDAEREAVERAIKTLDGWQKTGGYHSAIEDDAATLRGLLERLGN